MPETASREFPLVTVVTPSYNQGRYIEATLLSVMQQDYPNLEHIVVDGGSTDETRQILECYQDRYNLKWTSAPDKGQSDAINRGLDRAGGVIIGWLNSDDVYLSRDVIRVVVAEFQRHPEAGIIYGDHAAIDDAGRITAVARIHPRFNLERLLRRNRLSQPATFYRGTVLTGERLDLTCDLAMDYDLHLRLARGGAVFRYLAGPLAGFRITPDAKSSARAAEQMEETDDIRLRHGYGAAARRRLMSVFDAGWYAFLKVNGVSPLLRLYGHRGDATWWAFPARFDNAFSAVLRQLFGRR